MRYVFARARIRVRDSSEKPAMSVANEDLQRIARPERSNVFIFILDLPIIYKLIYATQTRFIFGYNAVFDCRRYFLVSAFF